MRVLIEGDSEAGASPLVWKMLLGRVEVPKVLRSARKSCPACSAKARNGASASGVVSGMSTLSLRHNDQMGFVKRLKCEFEYTVKWEVFTLPHQFLVESSGFLRIPRNPRNEPEFENLRIFIKFSCVIPGSFPVHSYSIPGLLYQHQEWPGIFLRNPSGQTGSFPVIPYYYYIS
jgi:hypothetical protein